jgi:hypothetical protein
VAGLRSKHFSRWAPDMMVGWADKQLCNWWSVH